MQLPPISLELTRTEVDVPALVVGEHPVIPACGLRTNPQFKPCKLTTLAGNSGSTEVQHELYEHCPTSSLPTL